MYVLDTNVLSEMRKAVARRAHPNVQRWSDNVRREFLFLSTISILEIETGMLLMQRKDPFQAEILRQWLHEQILPQFAGHILGVDTEIALRCATLHVPITAPYADSLIAATALVHGFTVVTRNVKDCADGCQGAESVGRVMLVIVGGAFSLSAAISIRQRRFPWRRYKYL